jgi:hypothetical protein
MKKFALVLAAIMIAAISMESCKSHGEDCGAYQGSKQSRSVRHR